MYQVSLTSLSTSSRTEYYKPVVKQGFAEFDKYLSTTSTKTTAKSV